MAAIIDLPTEILLEVASHFDYCEDTAHACLALTCRRLYGLFMQEVIAYQAKQLDMLLTLSMITPSLYIDPSKELLKTDDDPGRNFFDRPFSEIAIRVPGMTVIEVRSVRCLICRSKHLRTVELLVTELCNLRDVAAIMNTCIGKAGLNLRITGSVSQELSPFTFQFHSNGLPIQVTADLADTTASVEAKQGKRRSLWSFFRRLLRKFPTTSSPSTPQLGSVATDSPALSVSVQRRQPRFRVKTFPEPELSSIFIDGPIPLLQSLYPITINALNSPITSLALHRISFTLFDWAQILPSITMPMLKDLTIGNLSIAFPDLLAFLERHDSIENLSLTDNNVIGIAKLPSYPILPRLNSLATSSEYLLPFLQHKKLGHLPALLNIRMISYRTISGPSTHRYPYPSYQLHPVYDLISGAQFSNLRVILDALRPSGLADWLLHSTPVRQDGKAAHHLAGVKTLIINGQDLSVSTELTTELEEWNNTVNSSAAIIETQSSHRIVRILEALIWTKCVQLKMLKLGGRSGLKARPVG